MWISTGGVFFPCLLQTMAPSYTECYFICKNDNHMGNQKWYFGSPYNSWTVPVLSVAKVNQFNFDTVVNLPCFIVTPIDALVEMLPGLKPLSKWGSSDAITEVDGKIRRNTKLLFTLVTLDVWSKGGVSSCPLSWWLTLFFRGSLPFALSEIIKLLLNNLKILWLNAFIWFKTPAFKAFRNKVREIHVPSSLDCSHRGCALQEWH